MGYFDDLRSVEEYIQNFNLIFYQYMGLNPHFGLEINQILGCPLLLRQAPSSTAYSKRIQCKETKIAWVIALVGSAVIFGLVHSQQGPGGVFKVGLIGVVFGLSYLATGRNL